MLEARVKEEPEQQLPQGAEGGRSYSDNTDDVCVIQCKVCLKPIALDCFTYHIKKAHNVLTQEYGEKTFLRRTYHRYQPHINQSQPKYKT